MGVSFTGDRLLHCEHGGWFNTNNNPRFANLLSKQGVQIVWYIAILVRDLSLSQMYNKIGISQATSVLRLKV